MAATHTWEADMARKLGIGGVINITTTRLGQTLHVPCSRGPEGHGHMVDVKIRPNLDPNGTAKQMIGAGWIVGRRRLICPDCRKKTKAEKRREQMEAGNMATPDISRSNGAAPTTMDGRKKGGFASLSPERRSEMAHKGYAKARTMVTLEQRQEWGRIGALKKQANKLARLAKEAEAAIPAPVIPEQAKETPPMATQPIQAVPSASDKARAAKREAMDLLTLSFRLAADAKSGQYETGYSDARIAKDTGLAEAKIAEMREEYFAPLGEPDELRVIRDDLAIAKASIAAMKAAGEQEIARIERRFAVLAQRMGWPLT